MTADVVSFVPGPAHVRAEVLAAMALPAVPHRSAACSALVGRVQGRLATLVGTTRGDAFVVSSTGTAALESAILGLTRRSVLVVSGGAFGDRLAKIVASHGLDTETLRVPTGTPVPPEALERALDAAAFDMVAIVHCETQSGVLSDVTALAAVVAARPGRALVVDAVSALGGAPLASDGDDGAAFDALGDEVVLVSVSGKALACPPGVAVMAVSPAAAERARASDRGGYALRLASLVDDARKSRTPQTPSVAHLRALDVQLGHIVDVEGLPTRFERHARLAATVQAWAEERFAVLAPAGARSPTVTTIENTRGIDVPELMAAVERRGFRIANGYGDLRNATFRIGHLGDVTDEQTAALLGALDEALSES